MKAQHGLLFSFLLSFGMISAHAENLQNNGFYIESGANFTKTIKGDSGTGLGLGVGYQYFDHNILVEPSIHYLDTGNAYGDKWGYADLDIGYRFNVKGHDVILKVGMGLFHSFANGGGSAKDLNVGLEVDLTKKWSVDLTHEFIYPNALQVGMFSSIGGLHLNDTTLSIKYVF